MLCDNVDKDKILIDQLFGKRFVLYVPSYGLYWYCIHNAHSRNGSFWPRGYVL